MSTNVPALEKADGQASPSFSCTKKLNAVERVICDDGSLADLDREMTGAYLETRKQLSIADQASLRVAQRRWLAARQDRCHGEEATACLSLLYEQRINELRLTPSSKTTDDHVSLKPGESAILSAWGLFSMDTVRTQCKPDGLELTFLKWDSIFGVLDYQLTGRGFFQTAYVDCGKAGRNRIRVKVGLVSVQTDDGYCGDSPRMHFSLWLDHRKIISAFVFTDKCQAPVLSSLRVTKSEVTYCLLPGVKRDGLDKQLQSAADGSCGKLPFIVSSGPDQQEFPERGAPKLPVSGYTVAGNEPMRTLCREMVKSDGGGGPIQMPIGFQRPSWKRVERFLPRLNLSDVVNKATTLSIDGLSVASFDLTNSGERVEVYSLEQFSQWFDGSAFAIDSPGILTAPFDVRDWGRSLDKGIYPFAFEHAEAFFYRGKTYLLLRPAKPSVDARVVALHGKSLSTECTFHKRPENF